VTLHKQIYSKIDREDGTPNYLCGMCKVAQIISVVFHPLFLVYITILMSYLIDQHSYVLTDDKALGVMMIMAFFLLVLLPMIGIFMLAGLKMISKVTMPKREDRIGPLIITLSFYIWFFINIHNEGTLPSSIRFVSLGVCLAVGTAFFINNFSKISLHAIGSSAMMTNIFLLLQSKRHPYIDVRWIEGLGYRVSAIFVVLLCLLVVGLVGTSRMYLKAHTRDELYGGYLVGMITQIVAFRIIM
jgi:PAP2 superfamily.